MSSNNHGRKSPSTVGQPDKYDELAVDFLYSVPEEEMGGEPIGSSRIDGLPGTPSDEPLTDAEGNEMVAGTYARERSARTDARYRAMGREYEARTGESDADAGDLDEPRGGRRPAGTYADVRAVQEGQRLGDVVEGDMGELVRGVSTGAYWEQALVEMDVPEPARAHVDPFAEVEPEHYTLETEERLRGEYEANERARAQAVAAEKAGIDREARSREDMQTRRAIREAVVEKENPWDGPAAQTIGVERVEPTADEPVSVTHWRDEPDPRASLEQETLAQVNQSAARLAEHFQGELAMTRASFSKCIARKVSWGSDVMSATMAVKEQLEGMSTVKQPIGSIDAWGQWETTVEATVTTLWSPKSPKQYQVGLVQDENGDTAKFTIWFAAGDKPTLAEGDRIRAERVRVNAYKGAATLAVVGDTDITVLERGDGPMTRRKKKTDEARKAPWDVESRAHSWINGMDVSRAAEVTRREMDRRHPTLKAKRQIRQSFGRLFSEAAAE